MIKELVSIVTPCYNGEQHIARLLDSVLEQSYPYVEHFVIDDGSTDNTKQVIQSYISRYHQKGYRLEYHYQENQGQSVAVNFALKQIRGEYFVWPDADDFYASSTAIEELVNALENTDNNTSMVRALLIYLDESTLQENRRINNSSNFSADLFEDCLFGKNGYWYIPGAYLCKTVNLFTAIPDKEIYTAKDAGQNWQLMLPLLYKQKCLTINKYLYNILERSDSHSRGQYSTLNQIEIKLNSYENTIINTLNHMDIVSDEKQRYIDEVQSDYQSKRIDLYFSHGKNKEARKMYKNLSSVNKITSIRYYLSFLPLGNFAFKALRKLRLR